MTHALLTALQWNCRSFSSAKTILTSKVKQLRPAFLLLQETLDTPKISGYDAFVNPSIPRKGATPGYAAILVDASIPAAQLQVPASNSNMHEVVAIVAQPPHAKKIILVSAYYQPYSSSTGTGPFTWLQHLINTNPNTPILVGGDFNAHHTAWGYSTNSARGTKLVELTEILNLQLMNDIIYPTRIGLHPSQKDTTPDLTWPRQVLRNHGSPTLQRGAVIIYLYSSNFVENEYGTGGTRNNAPTLIGLPFEIVCFNTTPLNLWKQWPKLYATPLLPQWKLLRAMKTPLP